MIKLHFNDDLQKVIHKNKERAIRHIKCLIEDDDKETGYIEGILLDFRYIDHINDVAIERNRDIYIQLTLESLKYNEEKRNAFLQDINEGSLDERIFSDFDYFPELIDELIDEEEYYEFLKDNQIDFDIPDDLNEDHNLQIVLLTQFNCTFTKDLINSFRLNIEVICDANNLKLIGKDYQEIVL